MSTVFITGANRGIGLGWVRYYLHEGARVIAGCRDLAAAKELNELNRLFPDRLELVQLDVTNQAQIQLVANQLDGRVIDILINNAGIYPNAHENLAIEDVNPADVLNAFAVNVVGPFSLTRALKKMLSAAQRPVVVNMASQMGSIDATRNARGYAYRISKSALNMFTRCFAHEAPNIITIALRPGWVKTAMGGEQATLEIGDSVSAMANVITALTSDHNGKLLDYFGAEQAP
jgi:NAD(P)-dependent dehydrogenase (short-subunit alcohol dehydrogenase family)